MFDEVAEYSSGLRLTNLQIRVMWSTHPFDPNCFDAFDPFLIGPELIICCPMRIVGLPAQIPRNFQTTVAHWSLDFSH